MSTNRVEKKDMSTLVHYCCICKQPMQSIYGRWGDGGACSRKCDTEMSKRVLGHYQPKEPILGQ